MTGVPTWSITEYPLLAYGCRPEGRLPALLPLCVESRHHEGAASTHTDVSRVLLAVIGTSVNGYNDCTFEQLSKR